MIQPVGVLHQTAAFSSYGTGLAQVFRDRVGKNPNRVAIIFEGTEVTYSQLYNRALSVASQLRSLGIRKGDKVGLLYSNSPEFASLFFAIVGVGAVVVPINPLLKTDEIAHILTDSDARILIAHASVLGEVVDALPRTELLEFLIIGPKKPDDLQLEDSRIQIENLTEAAPPPIDPFTHNIDRDKDLAFIVYTSGTTGKPKGAMISHANILSVLPYPLLSELDLQASDVWLGMLPLCHVYGLCVIIFGALTTGGTIVILPKFEPKAALEAIERERVTIIPAVPAMYQFMLMELANAPYDISSVRLTFSGAAPANRQLLEQIQSVFNSCVVEGYGLSETVCGATLNRPHAKKFGSVGRAVQGISIEIRDPSGRALPPGAENVGEITIKGQNIMVGYHKQPEATAEVIKNGWFSSGDLGYRDDEGYYYIVGRTKELIIRGGQNIYPREVEDVIARMPGVRDVAVIGVPDEFMGERVKAVVVLKDPAVTAEDIKEFCEKYLASYKVPRLVEFMSELPRNSTGKLLKRLLS